MRVDRRIHLVFGRCRVPTCYSTPLVGLLPSILSGSEGCLRLLVWASVRVLGAGRVEHRRNGGGWAQGVCRGQRGNGEAQLRVLRATFLADIKGSVGLILV